MQMGYDFENGRQTAEGAPRIGRFAEAWPGRGEGAAGPLGDGFDGHPDWAGLRARFLAIHALRRSLAASTAAFTPAGSFVSAAEAVLIACRSDLESVNPVYSGNGKAAAPIPGAVAGFPTSGDRGRQ